LKLFENYLANRTHFVSIEDIQSQKASATCGVPQGSNLELLFFLLCVNDITHVSNLEQLYLQMMQLFLFQQNQSLILQKRLTRN